MNSFLGSGWAFPLQLEQGDAAAPDVAMVSDEDLVAQSIWLILATSPGERVQRPDFGCGMHDLVFAVNDTAAAARISDEIRTALIKFEPRIDVLSVVVSSPPGQPTTLLVEITYRVRTTNNVFNLVYPFYLEGGGQ
ncbi:MAG TPA: GPW/gp25 family protein [Solirubrobacteraceae bacterium]|nr:GPW/gp25 family protein [Solirubrobacteraceae bacterium]